MDFRKSGLPSVRAIEKAFDFAYRQPMKQAWSELRGRAENNADVAVDTAKILVAAIPSVSHDLVAGHLAGWALPVSRDLWGKPQRVSVPELGKLGFTPQAAQLALALQNFRFDNPEFPRLEVRVSPSADVHVRLSCLAAATFHLECLMKKYGGLKAGETGQVQSKNGATLRKPPLDILRDELERCAFKDNIAFLGTTPQSALETRYKNALKAVETRIVQLKPPPPAPQKPQPAEAFNAKATPEQQLSALNQILRDSYYKGPYNLYMDALRAKMSVKRKMNK
jgi:hypothetical protein